MIVRVFEDKSSLSRAAADQATAAVRRAIHDHSCARIIVATGASQLDFLDALTNAKNIDWQRVEMFHLDEYIGLPITHPASFRKYLLERLIYRTGITCLTAAVIPAKLSTALARRCDRRLLTSLLSVSGRMGTWRLMIPQRISKRKSRTSSSLSMKRAAASKWVRPGSRTFRKSPGRPSPCLWAKSSRRKKSLPSFPMRGKRRR